MKKKKEDRFVYRVPYDIPIYWETEPTEQDIENVKKTLIGMVEFIKMEHKFRDEEIARDVHCEIEVVPCMYKEGYTMKTLTEFSFWCYYDHMGGKIYTYDLREIIKDEGEE